LNNLSERIIQKLSTPDSFERGKKYYYRGRVTDYSEDDNSINAVVVGTDFYTVKISKADLSAECTCVKFNREQLCKHLVALLFTILKGEIKSNGIPITKYIPHTYGPKFGFEDDIDYKSHHNKGSIEDSSKPDNQFKSFLNHVPRENLLNDINELRRKNPDIEEFFIHKYSQKSISYYYRIENNIKSRINSIMRFRGKNDYSNKVFTASREVNSLLQNLPASRQTSEFLLGTGLWISEKLNEIEDSNGVLGSLVNLMTDNACEYLNYAGKEDLVLFYQYTSVSTSFDFNIEIIESIFRRVGNLAIIDALVTKLERSVYKKDPDFGFRPESGWEIMMRYLRIANHERYEELIPDLMESSPAIKADYINYLYDNKRYNDVIALGYEMQDNPDIVNAYTLSLAESGDKQRIIEFYTKRLAENFSPELFKRFSEIDGIRKWPEWNNIVNNLLTDTEHIFYRAEILLYLKRYVEFIDFISVNGNEYYRNNSTIEKMAAKFSVTTPPLAVKLYHYLLEKEMARIKRTSRYDILMGYFEDLKCLNDLEYITNLKNDLIATYPTRKKLVAALTAFEMPGLITPVSADFKTT
jgi:hypothetical protein